MGTAQQHRGTVCLKNWSVSPSDTREPYVALTRPRQPRPANHYTSKMNSAETINSAIMAGPYLAKVRLVDSRCEEQFVGAF
jgi:hypothetical protein